MEIFEVDLDIRLRFKQHFEHVLLDAQVMYQVCDPFAAGCDVYQCVVRQFSSSHDAVVETLDLAREVLRYFVKLEHHIVENSVTYPGRRDLYCIRLYLTDAVPHPIEADWVKMELSICYPKMDQYADQERERSNDKKTTLYCEDAALGDDAVQHCVVEGLTANKKIAAKQVAFLALGPAGQVVQCQGVYGKHLNLFSPAVRRLQ